MRKGRECSVHCQRHDCDGVRWERRIREIFHAFKSRRTSAEPSSVISSRCRAPCAIDGRGFRSTDSSAKDAHIVATRDLSGLIRREAAAQHRPHQVNPLRVVLQTTRSNLLVRADANVLNANDINHFFQAVDVFFKAGVEMPDADRAARLGDRERMVAADLPRRERRRTHCWRPGQRGMRQE